MSLTRIVIDILIALGIVSLIVLPGYLLYGFGKAKTFEEGIWNWFHWLYGLVKKVISVAVGVYTSLIRNDETFYLEDKTLIPSQVEISALIKALTGQPYDVLSVDRLSKENGVFRLTLGATGLVKQYKDLPLEEIEQMVNRVVSNFWLDSRGAIPNYYVSARRDQCTLSVPLSGHGYNVLQAEIAQINQCRRASRFSEPSQISQTITETVETEVVFDIFGDGNGDSP